MMSTAPGMISAHGKVSKNCTCVKEPGKLLPVAAGIIWQPKLARAADILALGFRW
jgi:hypothetical protein